METVQDQISEMLKTYEGSSDPVESPATSSPATGSPSTDSPTTSAPSTDAPTTEVPDDKDKVISELRAKLAEKEAQPSPIVEAPFSTEPQDFVGDMDLDDLTQDKEALNTLLNTVYSKGMEAAKKSISADILKALPGMIENTTTVMNTLKETTEKFYTDNPDLAPFKKVVATVFDDIVTKYPNKKYNEVLKEVAMEARKRLDLKPNAQSKREAPPRLPNKKGTPPAAPSKSNPSPLQDELDEMNKTIRR